MLQELSLEASRFRDELWAGIRDLSRKTDLIVLVHNLSHKIPRYNRTNAAKQTPALSLLLDEAKSLGIPWVLAVTNKFSVSAHQHKEAINAVLQAYQASPGNTEVVNSCPYVMPTAGSVSWNTSRESGGSTGSQKLIFAPMNLVRMPFLRKDNVLPVEGVDSFCQLVHRVLRSHEEASLQVREIIHLLRRLFPLAYTPLLLVAVLLFIIDDLYLLFLFFSFENSGLYYSAQI